MSPSSSELEAIILSVNICHSVLMYGIGGLARCSLDRDVWKCALFALVRLFSWPDDETAPSAEIMSFSRCSAYPQRRKQAASDDFPNSPGGWGVSELAVTAAVVSLRQGSAMPAGRSVTVTVSYQGLGRWHIGRRSCPHFCNLFVRNHFTPRTRLRTHHS